MAAPPATGGAPAAPVIRFRNYKPAEATVSATGPAKVAVQPITTAPSVLLAEAEAAERARLVSEHAARVAAGAKATAPTAASAPGGTADELAVTIAPKKATWDLKRDAEKKLAALERQTARAMAEIVMAQAKAAAKAGEGTSGGAGGGGGVDGALLARAVAAVGEDMDAADSRRRGTGGGGGAEEIDLDG